MSESGIERKASIPPQAMVELLFALRGGTFIKQNDFDLAEMLEEVEFPTGAEAKKAKLDWAQRGNVLVSRSIVTMTEGTADSCKILLSHREPNHLITTGASILTSGDPRLTPNLVLSNKVIVTPEPTTFERMGFALSSPK